MALPLKFLLASNSPGDDTSTLEIPPGFIDELSEKLPTNVRIQFPNGREVHVHYRKRDHTFINLDPLYRELGGEFGFFLILQYNGDGIFSVSVIDKDKTEIEYGSSRKIPRAPVIVQDKLGGKGWKFLAYACAPLYASGSLQIPLGFLERFETIIPDFVKVRLDNGEELQCTYERREGRLYGLLPIKEKKYAETWDLLLFTYMGDGKFDLDIFDASRTERLLEEDPIVIDSDGGESNDEELGNSGTRRAEVYSTDEDEDFGVEHHFMKVLSWSNINGSTHGVHIPLHVKPGDRDWMAGETVSVRTIKGRWKLGIVMTAGKPRFSSGWNKFCEDNKFIQKQKLSFTLVEEDDEFIFYVQ